MMKKSQDKGRHDPKISYLLKVENLDGPGVDISYFIDK